MQATVLKSTGIWYDVATANGKQYKARIKGVLKIDGHTSTNPIAVGDEVICEMENELEDTLQIHTILPRINYVARVSPHNKNQHHIIAANLQQSVLFATLKNPKTSQGFIDRFLVACQMQHIPAVLVFNKQDIYSKKEDDVLNFYVKNYTPLGYKVLACSVQLQSGLENIKTLLANKTSLLSGHSGTGKSSFINYLFPELQLKTNEVSSWSGKGLHTTTFAQMYSLPFGGKIIDTPGIRELGLVDVTKQELSGYFPEMESRLQQCKFNNCLHINEPHCAVKQAVDEGKITKERFFSYYNILESLEK
jgi:ribosome biogenesis GTPase